jgi:Alkylmercury lyase
MSTELLDKTVRVHVYRVAVETGKVPTPPEIAASLGLGLADVEEAIQRLAQNRVWFTAPGTSNIWAANPFCAVPSNFKVEALGRTYWGVCIWEALGIPAALHADATITTSCPDCNDRLVLEIRDGQLARRDGIVHFAVPALQWWHNIAFT